MQERGEVVSEDEALSRKIENLLGAKEKYPKTRGVLGVEGRSNSTDALGYRTGCCHKQNLRCSPHNPANSHRGST
jgi:hypothetical protein